MPQSKSQSFFDNYAVTSMQADAEALAKCYGDEFLVSGRDGTATFSNDETFLVWLRGVFDRNRQVGMQSLDVASLVEAVIEDHHAFATVEWAATFTKTGDEQIRFKISYLLRLTEQGPLILAYVTHEDEQELMEAKGLV
jgi:hypothetical protein